MFTTLAPQTQRGDGRNPGREGGFTLVELLVGIGIFAILMAMVSAFMAVGLRSLRTASTANSLQAQQQVAVIEMSKQIKFIDNPSERGSVLPAILKATANEMVFFTFSGSGDVDRLPYKVMLCETANGVEVLSVAPQLASGSPVENQDPNLETPASCTEDTFDPSAALPGATRRLLIAADQNNDPELTFAYFDANDQEIFPYSTGAEDSRTEFGQEMRSINKVTVRLADPSVGAPTEQTVVLANER